MQDFGSSGVANRGDVVKLHRAPNVVVGRGFTLIEVLIALTVTLLVLLAVARTIKSLGDRINDSQAELKMSADLRDIVARLREELGNATHPTFDATSPDSNNGYLVYHEGHMTDGTTSMPTLATYDAIGNASDNTDFFPYNRFGDLDDYLAFTANAPSDEQPFMGYLPRGVLAAHAYVDLWDKLGRQPTAAEFDAAYTSVATYDQAASAALVPFYSEQAEIAYWLSPQWNGFAPGGQPIYRDINDDLLPDRMRLHRRVLLIRGDLNMSLLDIDTYNNGSFVVPAGVIDRTNLQTIPFLIVTGTGTGRSLELRPITSFTGAPGLPVNYWTGNQADTGGWPNVPGNWAAATTINSPNWLTGIARLQQVMDLSVSRVINQADWSTPVTATDPVGGDSYGMPSIYAQANSLADLSRPENRFAFVRIPRAIYATTAPTGSSMPVLGLSSPLPFLSAGEHFWNPADPDTDGSGFFSYGARIRRDLQAQADPDGTVAGSAPGAHFNDTQYNDPLNNNALEFYAQRYGKFTLTGFLRPEFALADVVTAPSTATGNPIDVRINRVRTDVIAQDVLSFDVKLFEPQTPVYTWLGPDGVEGNTGDDNGDNRCSDCPPANNFDSDELGFANSDDEIVRLDDFNIREALTSPAFGGLLQHQPLFQGGFIDLHFLRLAGHPIGSIADPAITRQRLYEVGLLGQESVIPPTTAEPKSTFGIGGDDSTGATGIKPFPVEFQGSGLIVTNRNNARWLHSFFQSNFDTWTDYAGDGFDQERTANLQQDLFTLQYDQDSLPGDAQVVQQPVTSRAWSAQAELTGAASPVLDVASGGQIDPSGTLPIRVTAPVERALQGIRVDLRLYERGVGRVRQQSVIVQTPK